MTIEGNSMKCAQVENLVNSEISDKHERLCPRFPSFRVHPGCSRKLGNLGNLGQELKTIKETINNNQLFITKMNRKQGSHNVLNSLIVLIFGSLSCFFENVLILCKMSLFVLIWPSTTIKKNYMLCIFNII